MFTDFFYLLRLHGMKVSFNEWMTLTEAMEKGLHGSSLTGFYYLARAILVKTEADFDRFDGTFLEYFKDVEQKEIPKELLDWLSKPKEQKDYNKDDVDAAFGGMSPEDIRKMLEQRLKEQTERHDGGNHWVGTGGTSLFGNSGYNPNGFRVGGESTRRSALQVAAERNYRDFREDKALEMRQFQMAFRRLRQFSTRDTGPKDVLDLDATIRETCDNAGNLSLVFGRPRKNTVKLLMLFDSGGSSGHI
ncbi:MAG: VWA containing CoxE family protein, partial [Ruminococcaceae bacterium]|nr:VWA containing CoxE family protein [Oscillospiraceae bacterium]